MPETFDHDGILEKIRVVGKAIGADEKAAALAADVDAELTAAEALTAGIKERKRVLFILSHARTARSSRPAAAPPPTASSRSPAASMPSTAFAGYKQLTDEAIIAAKPDVILMMDRGGDHAIARGRAVRASGDRLDAGRAGASG